MFYIHLFIGSWSAVSDNFDDCRTPVNNYNHLYQGVNTLEVNALNQFYELAGGAKSEPRDPVDQGSHVISMVSANKERSSVSIS